MNREIITPSKIAAFNRVALQIQQKIDESKIESLLNSDLETHIPAASELRARLLTPNVEATTSVDDLLDGEIDDRTADILRNKRLEILEKAKTEAPKAPDNYLDRLVKYIPTEVIAFYLALTSQLLALPEGKRYNYAIGLILAGIGITAFYLKRVSHVKNGLQIIISCVAFSAWAIGLSEYIQFDEKVLLIPFITFAIPFISPPDQAEK